MKEKGKDKRVTPAMLREFFNPFIKLIYQYSSQTVVDKVTRFLGAEVNGQESMRVRHRPISLLLAGS